MIRRDSSIVNDFCASSQNQIPIDCDMSVVGGVCEDDPQQRNGHNIASGHKSGLSTHSRKSALLYKKLVLTPGTGELPYPSGTKVSH